MTLVTSIAAVAIFTVVLLAEVERFANIFEALSTGIVKTDFVKNDKAEKVNWKEAYAAR